MAAEATSDGSVPAREESLSWSRRDGVSVAIIFVGALALRLLHLQQIRANDPFFANPSIDPRLHHEAAVAISRGEVFTEGAEVLASLYPYFLAAIYAVTGPSFLAAKLVQSVLGAASCVLVYALARRLFGRRAAVLAGAAAAAYSMLVFYAGTLTIVNILLPLTLLALLCIDRAFQRPGVWIWLLAGALVGLTALCRPTALIFVPLLLPWMLWCQRDGERPGRRLVWIAAFCTGVALAVLPPALRMNVMGSDWRGGVNFYIGNNPSAVGTFVPPQLYPNVRLDHPTAMRAAYERFAEERLGRELSPAGVSAFWLGEGLRFIRENPGPWLRLELRKLANFFNAVEVWTNRSHTVSKEFSWVLRLPLLTFGVVAPLALVGMVLTARGWRRLAPLHLMLAAYLAMALIFFVAARYRMPIAPLLMIFAAAALVRIFDAVRARETRTLVLSLTLLALFACVVHLPILRDNLSMAYYNLGNRYKELEKWDLAIASYQNSLARNPNSISTWNNLALALEGAGDREAEAAAIWQRIYAWAQSRNAERYLERASRHLRELGADPSSTPGGGPAPPPSE